jgi:hypothetical protein
MTRPFSSQVLGRIFDARTITHGRSPGLAGQVGMHLEGDTIIAIEQVSGVEPNVRITPSLLRRRVVFDHHCTCRIRGCQHVAPSVLAALDRCPSLRKPEQQTILDLLAAAPEQEVAFHKGKILGAGADLKAVNLISDAQPLADTSFLCRSVALFWNDDCDGTKCYFVRYGLAVRAR